MIELNTTAISVVDSSVITALTSNDQPKIHVLTEGTEREILLQESIGNILFPAQLDIKLRESEKDLGVAGLVVLPLEGGGRGPIINHGETITLSLLFSLLANALTKNQLGPELISYLDRIPKALPNTKEQSGYGSHDDVIVLNHDWSGHPPMIELMLAQGPMINIIHTQVGIDPDCITYVEIPQQEIIYGHTGVVTDNTFTIKAAILEKAVPVLKTINWTAADITGPPLTVLTTESPVTNTTNACMGLRIKGVLGLSNNTVHAVAGAMYAQMSVDAEPWVSIAVIHWNFDDNDGGIVSEKFDVIMAYNQSAHSYKFRGYLVVDSDDEPNRQLTGSISIDTVTESGSGTILSNDLLLKWSSKEKL